MAEFWKTRLWSGEYASIMSAMCPIFHGINQIGRPSTPDRLSREDCVAIYDQINAVGGNATYLSLLDIGIFGNGHMMFWEDNSVQIAKVVLDWIRDRAAVVPRP